MIIEHGFIRGDIVYHAEGQSDFGSHAEPLVVKKATYLGPELSKRIDARIRLWKHPLESDEADSVRVTLPYAELFTAKSCLEALRQAKHTGTYEALSNLSVKPADFDALICQPEVYHFIGTTIATAAIDRQSLQLLTGIEHMKTLPGRPQFYTTG